MGIICIVRGRGRRSTRERFRSDRRAVGDNPYAISCLLTSSLPKGRSLASAIVLAVGLLACGLVRAATIPRGPCPGGVVDPHTLQLALRKMALGGEYSKEAAALIPDVQNLRAVYEQLSQASGLKPGILVCLSNDINAMAFGTKGPLAVTVTLLQKFGSRADMLAFVIGHELGHLALGHVSARRIAVPRIIGSATAIARTVLSQTGDMQQALRVGAYDANVLYHRYRQEQEMQADDYGTALIAKVGYKPEVAVDFMLGMLNITGYQRTGLFLDHPGWLDRIASVDLRVTDSTFEQTAKALTDGKHWRRLARNINEWLHLLPASPDAWYFKAQFLQQMGSSAYVASYENMKSDDTPPLMATGAQIEQSWLALCVGLIKTGHKLEAANCSRYLKYQADLDKFKRAFGEVVLVGGAEPRTPDLQMIKDGSHHVFITNDLSLLRVERLKPAPVPPVWHVLRYPPQAADRPLPVH